MQEQESSLDLLGIAEIGSDLEIRVADQVLIEYDNRVNEVQESSKSGLMKLQKQINVVDEMVAYTAMKGPLS